MNVNRFSPTTVAIAVFALFLSVGIAIHAETQSDDAPQNDDQAESNLSENQSVPLSQSAQAVFLGVQVAPVPPAVAAQISDFESNSRGVLIVNTTQDSPAATAGLKTHDILTQVDDQSINSPEELVKAIRQHQPNDEVKLKFYRGGKSHEQTVSLSAIPENSTAQKNPDSEIELLWPTPFKSWLDTPAGKKQTAEFDRRERERQSSPKTWSQFQSLNVTKSADGQYSANVEYRDSENKDLKRQYVGTREEIRIAINDDEELPTEVKEHLLRSLDQQTPKMFRFDWPRSLEEMFNRDFQRLENSLNF